MNMVVNCWDFDSFNSMVDLKVEKIRIGIKGFSSRFQGYFKIEDLKKLIKNKGKSKISVCINNFFREDELPSLIETIKKISLLKIDEISFGDLGVCQIIYENNISIKMHYNPETIITNYEQLYFFQNNNINYFTISNVLMKHEVFEFLSRKNNASLEMQVFGHTLFMFSRWPLISNFDNYLKSKNKSLPKKKFYIIKEDTRDIPNYIFEDESGTSMYSGFILNLSKQMKILKEKKLDYIFIESIFKDLNWLKKVVVLFKKVIAADINGETAYKELELLDPNITNSESFLGDVTNLPSFQRKDNES